MITYKKLGCGKDAVAYYADHASDGKATDYYAAGKEPPGVWQVYSSDGSPAPNADRLPMTGVGKGIPVQHGDIVDRKQFEMLAEGFHPATGKKLLRDSGKKGPRGHVAGYDLTASMVKSASGMWALAGDELQTDLRTRLHNIRPDLTPEKIARAIENVQREATSAAFDFGLKKGAFCARVRRGGKVELEPVQHIMVASFAHNMNREGDPNCHGHEVVLNLAMTADGQWRALASHEITKWKSPMAAVYRASFAAGLQRELGVDIERDGRYFRIKGFNKSLERTWSKRLVAMEKAAEELGFDLAEDIARGRTVNTKTRKQKVDLPSLPELMERRREEAETTLRSQGLTVGGMVSDIFTPDARTKDDPETVVTDALDDATAMASVLKEQQVWTAVAERAQGELDLAGIEAAVEAAKLDGRLVAVGADKDGNDLYSTPAMIALEKGMLRDVVLRKGEKEGMTRQEVMDAIAQAEKLTKKFLTAEQKTAVIHACQGDGVAVYEGYAGSGKSTSSLAVKLAYEARGYDVLVTAPSNKARNVIREDTKSELDTAMTVQKLVMDLDSGRATFDRNTMILVDEAGMVNLRDMAGLLRHAHEAKQRGISVDVRLTGDTEQLEAVGAGSPLTAIARFTGTVKITEIRRQGHAWMKAASLDLALNKNDEALRAYDANGRIKWCDGHKETLHALAEAWREHVRTQPKESRTVIAGTQKEVRTLNAMLRQAYRQDGHLHGDDLRVKAINRSGHLVDMPLARGDRIILGENINKLDLSNGDQATVTGLRMEGSRVKISFQLDRDSEKGQGPRSYYIDELVGSRFDAEDKHKGIPAIQHAYAATNHAEQGSTKIQVFVLNSGGSIGDRASSYMGHRATYVAMTRHKGDAIMFVDTTPGYDLLKDKMEEGETPTLEDIKKLVFEQSKARRSQSNITDFMDQDKAAAFLGVDRSVLEQEVHEQEMAQIKAELQAEMDAKAKADASASGTSDTTSAATAGMASSETVSREDLKAAAAAAELARLQAMAAQMRARSQAQQQTTTQQINQTAVDQQRHREQLITTHEDRSL